MKKLLFIIAIGFASIFDGANSCPENKCSQVAKEHSNPGGPTILLCGDRGDATCCLSCGNQQ